MKNDNLPGLAASLLAAASLCGADEPKSHKAEEKPLTAPGKGVEVLATLADSSFSYHPVSGPAFAITLTIRNHTAQPLELGETLVVLEQEKGSGSFVAAYQSREREKPAPRLARVKQRYGLDWGEEVRTDGSALLAFFGGGRFSVTFSRPGTYEGLGFGKVSPKAERTLKLNLPFPFKLKGERESLALVAPSVRGAGAPFETIVRFEPKAGADKAHAVVRSDTIPLREADLQKRAGDPALAAWERLFALNWLVEVAPRAAEPLLVQGLDQPDAPEAARVGLLHALGVAQSNASVDRLVQIASSSSPTPLRRAALLALGDIGSAQAAPAVRALLASPDDQVSGAAIEAAGKLKDDDAVVPLTAIFRDPKRGGRQQAGQALRALATPAARQALIGSLGERNDQVRQAAAEALGESGWKEAVAPLSQLALDAQAPVGARKAALESLAKLGGADAITTIQSALSDANEELYVAALKALLSKESPGSDAAALAALGSRHASVRRQAAETLGKRKPAQAVNALWTAYQKEADLAAGTALAAALVELKFQDKSAVDWLLARLDPKKNKLWHDDTLLLKQLSGQDHGPKYRWDSDKDRDAALERWREWGRTRP